jgi:lipopolysaccharide transport system permease protein
MSTAGSASAGTESPPLGGALVEPARDWELPSLRELWSYRELLYFLGWRDIKVRYKQTLIGAGWAILQPFLTMVIFSIIFGGLLAVPSAGVPYPVFSYAALLPWTFFAAAVTRASGSLVYDANLVSKVYFPRLLVPVAALAAPALDLCVASVILAVMLVVYAVIPGVNVLALPLFVGLAVLTAIALGIWLSALNVKYRDVGYVIPFLLQAWLFATPVAYPSSIVPEQWRMLYGLNPMAGVIEGVRWALFGTEALPTMVVLTSTMAVLALLVTGILYFKRVEAELADVV